MDLNDLSVPEKTQDEEMSQLKKSQLFSAKNGQQDRFNRWLDTREEDKNEDRVMSYEDKKTLVKRPKPDLL